MVSLYDAAFSKLEDVSIEEFEEKYYQAVLVAGKMASEAYAVNQLKKVIAGKKFHEIELIFNLYAVIREER